MQTRFRFAFLFAALTILSPVIADAFPIGDIACCDSVLDPSSCWLPPEATDLSECDTTAELAVCELDLGNPIACATVDLQCCPVIDDVVSLDGCKPHEPGMVCSGAVIGDSVDTCCQCGPGEPEAWCVESLDGTCPDGWDHGPLVCAP